ncbi:MAG: MIP/aquaporin family protein [Desulfuromonadales bacterium]|nr:MIP/aquaporin family protein [Desulfuromonadales bacterium]
MTRWHDFTGELVGTFILVLFGCGSVAVTILYAAHSGLLQIALIWGIAVALAIYATRHLSCAHLNPAVSLAMVFGRRMAPRLLPVYLLGQFCGAFLAAALLYLLFAPSIAQFELLNGIVRGMPESVRTAMMFGEFYPNPGAGAAAVVTPAVAMLTEGLGTFILVFMIFSLTEGCNVGRPDDGLAPIFIGLTVTIIIAILAPLTQAGLNPARDLAPRLFAALFGWGSAAFPDAGFGFLTVYVLAPIVGGLLAALTFSRLIEPQMKAKSLRNDGCGCSAFRKES